MENENHKKILVDTSIIGGEILKLLSDKGYSLGEAKEILSSAEEVIDRSVRDTSLALYETLYKKPITEFIVF